MKVPKKVCKVITLGFHWWKHYPGERKYIRCRLCGFRPGYMWKILQKMKGKK